MKCILVGVDESGRSDEAVLVGLGLARRFGSRLELVHGVTVTHAHWPAIARAQIDASIQRSLATVRTAVAAHLASRRHDGAPLKLGDRPVADLLTVAPEHPAKAILARASECGADLIVLGQHRRRGLFDLGGTTRAVLAKAQCPVWMQHGWMREVQRILAPIDLSDHSMAMLEITRDFARELGARVTALYCFVAPVYAYSLDAGAPMVLAIDRVHELRHQTQAEFERRMAEFDWKGVEHDVLFVEEDPVAAILAHQDAADLITMGTHGVTGFTATVLGSTAYGVARRARTPVLVMPHPERHYQL